MKMFNYLRSLLGLAPNNTRDSLSNVTPVTPVAPVDPVVCVESVVCVAPVAPIVRSRNNGWVSTNDTRSISGTSRGTLGTSRGTLGTSRGTLGTSRGTLGTSRSTLGTSRSTLGTDRSTLGTDRGTCQNKKGTFFKNNPDSTVPGVKLPLLNHRSNRTVLQEAATNRSKWLQSDTLNIGQLPLRSNSSRV